MELTWHGLSCFRMRERGMATVVTDPYSPNLGLPPLKLKADLVTVSHDAPGHNFVKGIKGQRLVIQGPGEFEVGNVFVTGITMASQEQRKNGAGPNTLGSVSRFLSEMGLSKLQPQPDLKVTKSALSDSTQVLLLEMES